MALERTVDDDGDVRFDLWVRTPVTHRHLGSRFGTPRELLHLGNWLSHRLGSLLTLSPPGLGGPAVEPLAQE